MKINLLTDAPKHNLALMKISAWHKSGGDSVLLNSPIFPADYTYASILFEKNKKQFIADEYGGPAFENTVLPEEIEKTKPDYSLYNNNFSLGYTYRPCSSDCFFCKVPKMNHPDNDHHSIWEFHDPKFKSITLLNNNTFQDPRWKETFEEIWDADLSVIDENGYDLRLLNNEKADAMHKTKWKKRVHFAWDRMCDETLITNGLKLVNLHKMKSKSSVYLLIGYDTTVEEDLYRCQIIHNYGLSIYPMPYVRNEYTRKFYRFINLHYYSKYKTVEKAWRAYK